MNRSDMNIIDYANENISPVLPTVAGDIAVDHSDMTPIDVGDVNSHVREELESDKSSYRPTDMIIMDDVDHIPCSSAEFLLKQKELDNHYKQEMLKEYLKHITE